MTARKLPNCASCGGKPRAEKNIMGETIAIACKCGTEAKDVARWTALAEMAAKAEAWEKLDAEVTEGARTRKGAEFAPEPLAAVEARMSGLLTEARKRRGLS